MATEQELQEREQQLNQVEQQAKQVASQKVPRRSFGSRIGAKEQQAVINNKQKALEVLSQIQQQRQQIQQIRQQQSQPQGRTPEEQYNYGRKLALSGKSAYGLSKTEQQGYRDAKQGLNQIEKIKQSQGYTTYQSQGQGNLPVKITISDQQAQELPPVRVIDYNNRPATIVKGQGAYDLTLDEIRKLELAQENKPNENTPQVYDFINRIQNTDNFLIKTTKSVVNAPVDIKGRNETIGNVSTQAIDFTTELFNKGEQGLQINNKNSSTIITNVEETLNKDARIVSEIAFYTATAPISLPVLTLSGLNRIFNAQSNQEFFTGVLEVLPFGLTKSTEIFKGISNYKFTDVDAFNIIESQKVIKLNTKQRVIENLVVNDLERISKENIYRQNLNLDLNLKKEILLKDLQNKLNAKLLEEPKLKIVSIDNKPLISINQSNVDYKAIRSLSNRVDEAIKYYEEIRKPLRVLDVKEPKSSINQNELIKDLQDKISSNVKDSLTKPDLSILDIGKLTKVGNKYNTKDFIRSFDESQLIDKKESIKVRLKEFVDFAKKEIELRKSSQIKIIPEGNKEFISLGSYGFGIVEKELIKGIENSQKFKVESVKPDIKFESPTINGNNILIMKDQQQELVKLDYVKLSNINASESIKQEALSITKLRLAFRSAYNLNNKSIGSSQYADISLSGFEYGYSLSNKYDESQGYIYAKATASRLRSYLAYNFAKEESFKLKALLKDIGSSKIKLGLFSGKSAYGSNLTKGFKTYYYSKGNKIYLGGISGKAEAIFKGEKKVLNDLSARFGIEETNKLVKGNNVNASPRYNKYFREFKIVKGKNIKTPNVFIQKRGKRLSTSIERSLIQKARKKR